MLVEFEKITGKPKPAHLYLGEIFRIDGFQDEDSNGYYLLAMVDSGYFNLIHLASGERLTASVYVSDTKKITSAELVEIFHDYTNKNYKIEHLPNCSIKIIQDWSV
jgi:hypothetical protein